MTGFITTIGSPVQPAIAAADPNFSSVSLLLTGNYPAASQAYNADSSPNQRIVTPFSTVKPSTASPYQDGDYGVQFNGTSQYLSMAANSAFDIGGANFTLEFWFNSTGGNTTVFNNGGQSGGGSYLVRIGNDGSAQFGAWSDGSTVLATMSSSASSFSLNTWNHLAVTRLGNLWTIWINGVNTASTSSAGSVGNTGRTVTIGYESNSGGTSYFAGTVSNVRLVKGTALYTAAFTPPSSALTNVPGTAFLACANYFNSDLGPNAITITPTASPASVSVPLFTLSSAIGSAFFNGSSDYMTVPNPAMNVNWTVETWVYPTVNTGAPQVFLHFNNNGNNVGMGIFRNAAGNLALDDSNTVSVPFTNAALPLNTWTHVAITRVGTTVTGYVNGVSVGSGTFTPFGTINSLSIGRFGGSPPYWFNGNLSNLRVVVGTALYSSNFTPSRVPLSSVTDTSLLTFQTGVSSVNTQFIDSSPQNRSLTTAGTPIQTARTPYAPATWGGSFNGSTDYLEFPNNAAFAYGTGDFTVEGWFNRRNPWTVSSSLVAGDSSGGCVIYNSSGNLYIAPQNGSGTILGSLATLATDTWYHIAVTRKSGSIRAYVNGQPLQSAISYTTSFGNTVYRIGGNADGKFNGFISNVRAVKGTAVYDPASSSITVPTFTLQAIAGTSLLALTASTFNDASSNNFTPTVVGTPTVTTKSPFVNSMLFGSTYFNGSSAVAAASGSATLGAGSFTAECWVNVASISLQTIMGNAATSGGGDTQWQITILADGTFRFQGWFTVYAVSSTAITANTWNHIAVVRNGTALTLYLNGVSVATATNSTNFSSTNGTTIGRSADGSTWPLTGYITDARVTPGTALYTAAFTPPNQPLQANWRTQFLLNSANTSVYDTAGKSVISTVGTAQARSTVRRYGPSSVFLNGTASSYLTVPNSMVNLGSGNFTIEAWLYQLSRASDNPAIFSNYNSFTGSSTLSLFAGHSAAIVNRFQVALSGTFPALQSTATIAYNTWQHVAIVRSSGTLTLYVDGVSQGSVASSATLSGVGTNAFIGNSGDSLSTCFYNGYIDDYRITPGVARYTANFTPPAIASPTQ